PLGVTHDLVQLGSEMIIAEPPGHHIVTRHAGLTQRAESHSPRLLTRRTASGPSNGRVAAGNDTRLPSERMPARIRGLSRRSFLVRKSRARHVWLVPGSRKGWHRAVWTQDGENPRNKSNALPSERKQGP